MITRDKASALLRLAQAAVRPSGQRPLSPRPAANTSGELVGVRAIQYHYLILAHFLVPRLILCRALLAVVYLISLG